MEKLYTVKNNNNNNNKKRPGADCGPDHQLLIAKFRFKLKKWVKPLGQPGTT